MATVLCKVCSREFPEEEVLHTVTCLARQLDAAELRGKRQAQERLMAAMQEVLRGSGPRGTYVATLEALAKLRAQVEGEHEPALDTYLKVEQERDDLRAKVVEAERARDEAREEWAKADDLLTRITGALEQAKDMEEERDGLRTKLTTVEQEKDAEIHRLCKLVNHEMADAEAWQKQATSQVQEIIELRAQLTQARLSEAAGDVANRSVCAALRTRLAQVEKEREDAELHGVVDAGLFSSVVHQRDEAERVARKLARGGTFDKLDLAYEVRTALAYEVKS